MNRLKALFRFYVNASIHVALSVVALTAFTILIYDIKLDFQLLGFIFFSTITAYNFVKYAPIAKLYHRRLTDQLKQIQFFSVFCFVGLCISAFYINIQTIVVCLILGLMTLFYAIPVGRSNLRGIPVLKVFVIALIWATTSFILPFLSEGRDIFQMSSFWYLDFIERFIWVVLLMIPFEIRDFRYDQKYLKTLVSVFGVQNIKWISIVVLLVLTLHKLIYFNLNEIGLYLFIYITLVLVIVFSRSKQRPYFASFWVESLPVFWLIMSSF